MSPNTPGVFLTCLRTGPEGMIPSLLITPTGKEEFHGFNAFRYIVSEVRNQSSALFRATTVLFFHADASLDHTGAMED